jgi:hypothetical protein
MGGSVNIQSRYWGSSNFQETFLSFSQIINTMHTLELSQRIPIGIYSNDPRDYENFHGYNPIFKPGGYKELLKVSNLAPDELCCIYDWRYGWINEGNEISQIANLNNNLLTCDSRTIQVGRSSICDEPMYRACILDFDNHSHLKYKCSVWLKGLYLRFLTASDIITRINDTLTPICITNIDYPICESWLSAIRNGGNIAYFSIADNVLTSQRDKTNLKCAFPPDYILQAQRRVYTPRECWYRECAFSPNYLLLSENIAVKNNCLLTECNINIGNLDILSLSDITLTCNNSVNVINSKEKMTMLLNESEDYRFLVPDNIIIFILLIILIFLILIKNN